MTGTAPHAAEQFVDIKANWDGGDLSLFVGTVPCTFGNFAGRPQINFVMCCGQCGLTRGVKWGASNQNSH